MNWSRKALILCGFRRMNYIPMFSLVLKNFEIKINKFLKKQGNKKMDFSILCPHSTSYSHCVLSCDGSLPSFAVLPNTSHVAAVRQYSCQYDTDMAHMSESAVCRNNYLLFLSFTMYFDVKRGVALAIFMFCLFKVEVTQ